MYSGKASALGLQTPFFMFSEQDYRALQSFAENIGKIAQVEKKL